MGRRSRPNNDFPGLWPNIRKSIRILRQAHRLNQEELADRIGVLRTTVTNIETGNANTTIEQLYAIAHVFNMDVSALLPTMDDAMQEPKNPETLLEELAACILSASEGNESSMVQAEEIARRILKERELTDAKD
jgi:transcriptional regulator with XRE-family HTH domain